MPNKGDSKASKYDKTDSKGNAFSEMRINTPPKVVVKISHPEEHGINPSGK